MAREDIFVSTDWLAERLGARLVTLHGDRLSTALLEFAHREGVTRIIIGKPTHRRWRDLVFGSVLEEVVRGSGQPVGEPEPV